MLSYDNYRRPDGTIDLNAFHQAEENIGERCYKCKTGLYFSKNKSRSLCSECSSMTTDIAEVTHGSLIRCPKCKNTFDICDDYELYDSGQHDVNCPECNFKFQIDTFVEHSFTSPALLDILDEEGDDA